MDRLAQALGVSTRTLHRVFMRQYGLSPMTLLRLMRLATARQKLEAPRPGTTVTTVALDSGFVHLSRFSQEYARRFGECPSETLRRARRRAVSSTGHAVSVQASAALEAQRVA